MLRLSFSGKKSRWLFFICRNPQGAKPACKAQRGNKPGAPAAPSGWASPAGGSESAWWTDPTFSAYSFSGCQCGISTARHSSEPLLTQLIVLLQAGLTSHILYSTQPRGPGSLWIPSFSFALLSSSPPQLPYPLTHHQVLSVSSSAASRVEGP